MKKTCVTVNDPKNSLAWRFESTAPYRETPLKPLQTFGCYIRKVVPLKPLKLP